MTLHRTIKWLTILMLVLSLAIAWGWHWSINHPGVPLYLKGKHTAPMAIDVIVDDHNDIRLIRPGQYTPGSESIGQYVVSIEIDATENLKSKFPSPIEYIEKVTIKFEGDELKHTPPFDIPDAEILESIGSFYFRNLRYSKMLMDFAEASSDAIERGSGTRTIIHWPGVAQRVRIYAPRALALTGFLTLAGFTTLFIQRRKLRRRIRAGHCPNCNYDLAGINSSTCPECGTSTPSPLEGEGGRKATG